MECRRELAPRRSSARLAEARAVVPNLGVEQHQAEAHQEDQQAAELPSLEAVVAVVARVAVPIRRALAVVRLPARRAWALRKKHKTYWWGGFGNRTAGTRSSFLRLGRCRQWSQLSVSGSIPGLW